MHCRAGTNTEGIWLGNINKSKGLDGTLLDWLIPVQIWGFSNRLIILRVGLHTHIPTKSHDLRTHDSSDFIPMREKEVLLKSWSLIDVKYHSIHYSVFLTPPRMVGRVSEAHLAMAEKTFPMPVSFGFSRPRIARCFITDTNSCEEERKVVSNCGRQMWNCVPGDGTKWSLF